MSWQSEALRLQADGCGPREISRTLDVPYTTVWRCLNSGDLRPAIDGTPKILIADIETAPTMAYVWRRWKQDIHQKLVIREGYLLSWAAKWLGSGIIMSDSLFKNRHQFYKDPENDKGVAASMWKLLDQCDMVVFHNGDKFDIPILNSRFLLHGFNRPGPYKPIDTLKIAKRTFGFPSNALDSIAQYLGLGKKIDDGGFDTWAGCMDGDPESWALMMEYNIHDINILEKVYLKMRAWDHRHPNVALHSDSNVSLCGVCGSSSLRLEKKSYHTSVNRFPVFRCGGCGALSRSRSSELDKSERQSVFSPVPK